MPQRCYYTYILTNALRSVLYIGITNNLKARLVEHYLGVSGFTARYGVHYLLYYETSRYVLNAIRREKELKGWTRAKKMKLIAQINPGLDFLNTRFFPHWPPQDAHPLR
ncbi:GIY-YIG nuclease family protein [Flaviaesturariibacter flavus]|uniref:GIY-YIG nuclease family protein n=1 Tax=Flaviaesturariibacter flavus TaxID=2502780 RepID=A0A4R1B8Q4_9BACT|nr:GIY-YIG nuclease family protein [Flaviaesturariibacter flavus]TCJ12499.1 GIY-YIG nuclease family protein [Flaviaesturariibacter flavus]